MEWKGMKRIILEYSSLPYLRVLMEGMKNIFSVWEFKWEGMEWVGGNIHSSIFP